MLLELQYAEEALEGIKLDPKSCCIIGQRWLEELDKLSEFQINRCIQPKGFEDVIQEQLHHFSDSSE